jgi:hypothetical protein
MGNAVAPTKFSDILFAFIGWLAVDSFCPDANTDNPANNRRLALIFLM